MMKMMLKKTCREKQERHEEQNRRNRRREKHERKTGRGENYRQREIQAQKKKTG